MSYPERRQHPRHSSSYAIELSTEAADGSRVTVSGTLRDISDSGISFVSRSNNIFQPGQKVDVSILAASEASEGHALHAKGEIIWIEHSRFEFNQVLTGLHLEEIIEAEGLASDD